MFINLENPFFIVLALCGALFIVAGYIMSKYPPKSINYIYGYRTPKSMKSEEIWSFAQKYASHRMIKYGIGLLIISLLGLLNIIPISITIMFSAIFIFILFSIILIIDVEIELKEQLKKKD